MNTDHKILEPVAALTRNVRQTVRRLVCIHRCSSLVSPPYRLQAPRRFLQGSAVAIALATPFAARGQSDGDPEWNHFGVDFRLGLNIKAKFGNIGASTSQPAPPSSGGVDHTYADGFVRIDSSGDRGGLTWNWGYENASQVNAQGTLLMHATSTDGATSSANDNPRLGFEASYARDLAHFHSGRWGLKLALGYTDVQIRDTQPLQGNANLITDAYSVGRITPPLAPYAGSFSGPGPVIGDTPTRAATTIPGGAVITGSRQLDIWLYDLRLGPYLELPLFERLTFQVGSGFAAGLVDSTFSSSDTTTTSAGKVQAAGTGQRTGSLVGFYGEAGLAYQVVHDASVFAGWQFQYLGEFNQNSAGRVAQLDLRRSIYFVVGVQWHF
jgi:hypothetical protein